MTDSVKGAAEPISAKLFNQPLEFLLSEHYRQRIVCNTLELSPLDPRNVLSQFEIKSIINHLSVDYPLHMEDEERSLFPLLKKRCLPADDADAVLDQLVKGHEIARPLIADVIEFLNATLADRDKIDEVSCRCCITVMTQTQRQHLDWENSVVLPLANRRLEPADLADLGRQMALRRGIEIQV